MAKATLRRTSFVDLSAVSAGIMCSIYSSVRRESGLVLGNDDLIEIETDQKCARRTQREILTERVGHIAARHTIASPEFRPTFVGTAAVSSEAASGRVLRLSQRVTPALRWARLTAGGTELI
jgi:hypothetical protein